METKELKIQVPEGYEIDKENSTFECIKFKSIKKYITYETIWEELFNKTKFNFYISGSGAIGKSTLDTDMVYKNNAINRKQLEKILALNQLLNIAEYYNNINSNKNEEYFYIVFHPNTDYQVYRYKKYFSKDGLLSLFNRKEDAQAVINNPNFREILDTIYKQ